MGKESYNKYKAELQKLFNENKELKRILGITKAELERAKKPCKCQKPEKEIFSPMRQENLKPRVEAVREVKGAGSCPLCSGVTIKAEYTKVGVEMVLIRCTEPGCKFRTNGRKE